MRRSQVPPPCRAHRRRSGDPDRPVAGPPRQPRVEDCGLDTRHGNSSRVVASGQRMADGRRLRPHRACRRRIPIRDSLPAIVATVDPQRRDPALLTMTIVVGFASSIFFRSPAGCWSRARLADNPAVAGRAARPHRDTRTPNCRSSTACSSHHCRHGSGAGVWQALRDHRFWLLALAFVAQCAAVSAVGVLLVSFLRDAGHSPPSPLWSPACGASCRSPAASYPPACHAAKA